MSDSKWYENHALLVTFASVLNEADQFASVEDVIYFFEKPWKWETEYQEWKRLGRLRLEDIEAVRGPVTD